MYFEIEDSKPDIRPLGGAITWRDGVFLSIIVHLLFVIAWLLGPRYIPWLREAKPRPVAAAQRSTPPTQFVFVNPKIDLKALKPPEKAPPSDMDREARTREQAPRLENPLPTSRGNTRERVEQSTPEVARGRGGEPESVPQPQETLQPPAPQVAENLPRVPEAPSSLQLPSNRTAAPTRPQSGGSLGDALRNLQRYVEKDQFQNVQGNGAFGPAIQFDTKGVEFGPWIRRFIAQVKRNWLIPYAAMSMKGHVVVTFNVHKDGSISDLIVIGPSAIEAFNNAAFGALVSSNPTQPLPPEYPVDKAFFTVTFFYNEQPQ
jgi:TonB family protein